MKPWNGRFRSPLNPTALKFSSSLAVDSRLAAQDIAGSIAHVAMLARQRIIPAAAARKIESALREIRAEIRSGKFVPQRNSGGGRFVAEDVHMAVEKRVIEKTGEIGGMLHTARSRNDQIALDERLYLRDAMPRIVHALRGLQTALVRKARTYRDVVMPGYTHLQRAQPVLLAHHLLAHVEMLDRDKQRFADCLGRASVSPLGAGALAGTSFPIDRHAVARQLGLRGIVRNSLDAVSDRDVLIECVFACALTMMHLSRLAEELILWSSKEWSFAEIDDAFTTGSSIMPQKKNPDMAELVRGKTGRVYGDLVGLLTLMKGLPLAYNRDMQEDKEPLFDAVDTVTASLRIFAGMIGTVTFDRTRFLGELKNDFLVSTELADYLVRKGFPFRKAHGIVGSMVSSCMKRGISLSDLTAAEFRKFSPHFGEDVIAMLDPSGSVARKKSEGSTSPREVDKAIRRWGKKLVNSKQ